MAAFTVKDPEDSNAFTTHREGILNEKIILKISENYKHVQIKKVGNPPPLCLLLIKCYTRCRIFLIVIFSPLTWDFSEIRRD